jgi:hypothetical protein
MIISIVAFGDKYIDNAIPHILKFIENGWDVHILTDKPQKFKIGVTHYYPNKIFSYFDKLLFPLRLMEEYNVSVAYVDADWIQNIGNDFVTTFKGDDEFLFYDNWPNGEHFEDYQKDTYFTKIIDFWDKTGFNYNKLTTILEWFYFIPYQKQVGDLIYDVEKIKPVFEYSSFYYDTKYSGIGNGEGLALSYILKKHNIPLKKIHYSLI